MGELDAHKETLPRIRTCSHVAAHFGLEGTPRDISAAVAAHQRSTSLLFVHFLCGTCDEGRRRPGQKLPTITFDGYRTISGGTMDGEWEDEEARGASSKHLGGPHSCYNANIIRCWCWCWSWENANAPQIARLRRRGESMGD